MPMTRALAVRLRGPMPQETLQRLRELLGLTRIGRLTDAEDVTFGNRYLQHDDENWIHLRLSREDDTTWVCYLTYLNEAPPDGLVDRALADIQSAATQLGFSVEGVVR